MIPIIEYSINYEYISKVLCVNKQKKNLHCNGKCYLIKELAKASEDEKPFSEKKSTLKQLEILFFQEIQISTGKTLLIKQKNDFNFDYSNLYKYLNKSNCFRPPTIISNF